MKKILIIYATAGIGHKKAAFAVNKAFGDLKPKDAEVSIIDSLDYTSRLFRLSYAKGYLLLVNKFPWFWGFLDYLTDNILVNLVAAPALRLNNWLNSRRLVRFLLAAQPDVIVSTHFFASEVAASLKRKKRLLKLPAMRAKKSKTKRNLTSS